MLDELDVRRKWCLAGLLLVPLWSAFALKPLDGMAPLSFELYYFSQAVVLLGMALAVSFVGSKRLASAPVVWAVVTCMMVATAMLLWQPAGSGFAWIGVAAALHGASYAAAYLLWFLALSRQTVTVASFYALVSFAVMPLARLPLELLPLSGVLLAMLAALPFVGVLLMRSFALNKAEAPGSRAFLSASAVWPVLAGLVVLGLVIGLFRFKGNAEMGPSWIMLLSLAFKIAFPLALLFFVVKLRNRASVGMVCQLALVFLLVAIALGAFFDTGSYEAFAVFDCARQGVYVLMFYVLCMFACQGVRRPVLMFCAGWGGYMLALSGSMVIAAAGFVPYASQSAITLLVCLLGASGVVLFGLAKGSSDVLVFPRRETEAAAIIGEDDLLKRCESIKERFSLTNRERDVLLLMARGQSRREIAENLILSENTVRGYSKTLYQKTSVHSRKELQELVCAEQPSSQVKSITPAGGGR